MEEKSFEITPVLTENGYYEIANFEGVLAQAKEYVENILSTIPQEIISNDSLAFVKANRTEIRKQADTIKKARLQINDLLLGTFNSQLKELEKLLKTTDDTLKEKVDTFNESIGNVKAKTYKITITTTDESVLKKLEAIALKFNCTYKEEK